MMMDIPQVLAILRTGEDWGPCAQSDSTYADLAAMWRAESPCPSLEEMESAWAAINATEHRKAEIEAIDAACREQIAQGFAFAGKTFSLSSEAQMNWTNMYVARGLLSYPLEISTKDDGKHTLTDSAAVVAFYATGIATVKAALDAARAAKTAL